MPRPLLFDLDGTLIDSLPDVAVAVDATLVGAGLEPLGLTKVRHMVGWGAGKMLEMAFRDAGQPLDEAAKARQVSLYLDHYSARPAERTRVYDGVEDGLARLAEAGHPMGICSNKPSRMVGLVLTELGLDGFFCGLTGGDDVPHKKPDGRHLAETLHRMGDPKGLPIMIGDSQTDRGGAIDFGAPFIAVTWGYDHVEEEPLTGDAVIDHFDQIDDAIAALSEPGSMSVPVSISVSGD
ncbi:MAG: HAD hydrolase-like protein [Magnetovibrionaceae bacterium]